MLHWCLQTLSFILSSQSIARIRPKCDVASSSLHLLTSFLLLLLSLLTFRRWFYLSLIELTMGYDKSCFVCQAYLGKPSICRVTVRMLCFLFHVSDHAVVLVLFSARDVQCGQSPDHLNSRVAFTIVFLRSLCILPLPNNFASLRKSLGLTLCYLNGVEYRKSFPVSKY